nr:hypothetical protein [Tanacetum cinerariifolium]
MPTIKFVETHNLVAFLEKPAESEGFKQIVDFLNANPIKYALTVNPTIYTLCIQQFWDSAKVKTINEDVQIRALVDGKKLIINEASIICDLKLEDAEERRKGFFWDSYSLFETMMVQAPEEVGEGSEGGMIDNIDQDAETTLVDDTQGRMNEEEMFGVDDLDGDEVIMDVTIGENIEQDATVAEKEDELTLAQTLIKIKEAKPKARGVIVQEPSEFRTTSSSQPSKLPHAKEKSKGIMVKPEKPLKKKEQIMMDKEVARKSKAQMKDEMEEEKRMAREKDEANIAVIEEWDNIVEEICKKTQAEVTEGSSKRVGDELEQESAQRQRLEKEDDSEELKRCLEIVPEDDDDVTIEATPLSFKSPTIVDYKIYKEGKKSYFKIIRADGNSQNYLTFGEMFKNFHREDLEVLWSIVKIRFEKAKPVNDTENLLFQTLKTMFEHQSMVYYLLVEKMYPFTRNILHQLWNDIRLQAKKNDNKKMAKPWITEDEIALCKAWCDVSENSIRGNAMKNRGFWGAKGSEVDIREERPIGHDRAKKKASSSSCFASSSVVGGGLVELVAD